MNTFFGKHEEERWQPNKSTILQLALSLQSLVLNSNPYFNEADFDVYCNTEEGVKKSKMYNEFVIVSLIDYCMDLMDKRSNSAFKNEIQKYYQTNAFAIYKRYYDFIFISINWNKQFNQIENSSKLTDQEKHERFKQMIVNDYPNFEIPSYPILPASEGMVLSLSKNMKSFVTHFKDNLPAEVDFMQIQLDDLIASIEI